MSLGAFQVDAVVVAAVAAIAALIGAVIAAKTAASRQGKQLAAEAERQQAALDAETARQRTALDADARRHRETLEHERTLADLGELRTLLDEAAGELAHAARAFLDVETAVTMLGVRGETAVERANQASERLEQSQEALDRYSERIALRLGSEHEVYERYSEAHDATLMVQVDLLGATGFGMTEEHLQEVKKFRADFSKAHHGFLTAAELIVGSQVPGVGPTTAERLQELQQKQ
jgi:hypothetical protein